MATTIMEIPVDTSLKDKATEVFDKIGLDIPTAFRMFLTRSVYENGLPFGVTMPRPSNNGNAGLLALHALSMEAKRNGTSEMTLDEINAEIEAARAERSERLARETAE